MNCPHRYPIKDESIPKGSIDTEHDMNNSILHSPHTGPVSWANHMTPSPTVNRGHSQEMTSVKAVHTLHTKPRDGSTKQSLGKMVTHWCPDTHMYFVQITCERLRTYVHAHLSQNEKVHYQSTPPSRQQWLYTAIGDMCTLQLCNSPNSGIHTSSEHW